MGVCKIMINREQIDFLKRISPSDLKKVKVKIIPYNSTSDLMWFENSLYKNKVGLIHNISSIKNKIEIEVANMVGEHKISFKPSELEVVSELAIQLSLF